MRALFACAALVIASNAVAAVDANHAIESYPIAGNNAAELRAQMNALGPPGPSGRFDGYTNWNIQWRFNYRRDGGACAIAGVTVDLKTVTKLPEWRNEAAAPADLRGRWQRYLTALTGHENGHKENGLSAAQEIERGITALPPQSNCTAMGDAANAFGQGILRKYNQRDLDYDRTTGHGRAQGVAWP